MSRGPKRLSIGELAPYLLDLPDPPTLLDWPIIFGNTNPVEIEVGFGKGLFLLTASEAKPHVNFVGIEIVRKYQLFTANRIGKRQRQNVRLACADARLMLRDYVAPESCQAMHVYYPDPWWKQRHRKRLLFTAEFAAQCTRVLGTGGLLHFVTDVQDYFAMVSGLLAEQRELVLRPRVEESVPSHDMDYLTNFERKFRIEGRPIYRSCYEKLARCASEGEQVYLAGASG